VSVGAVAGFISLLGLPHPVMSKKTVNYWNRKGNFLHAFSAWIGFILKLLVPLFT
jgi:hypothetical protein